MMTDAAPKKVLQRAAETGIHNDCLAANDLCAECWEVMVQAIDFHYGRYGTPAAAASAYLEDLMEEAK